MVRTVWLGLSFLVILGGVVSFRIAFGYFDVANAASPPRLERKLIAEIKPMQDKPMQEMPVEPPQSPIADVSSATKVELAAVNEAHAELVQQTPAAIATSRINGRHGQERATPVIQRPANQKAKRKLAKSDASTDKSVLATEPKACQLADFEALRATFNLPTGCRT
jgi:hypothetical protein